MDPQGAYPALILEYFLDTLNFKGKPRLVAVRETWNFTSEDVPQFDFLSMLWKEGDTLYYYHHPEITYSPDAEEELFELALSIPRKYYLGELPPPGMTVTSVPLDDPAVYLKRLCQRCICQTKVRDVAGLRPTVYCTRPTSAKSYPAIHTQTYVATLATHSLRMAEIFWVYALNATQWISILQWIVELISMLLMFSQTSVAASNTFTLLGMLM
ncbi:hypothetical protein C8R46DRAFT_1224797 [Mycena filopes]|nr:hypothetical protein C8R46DRAFT_1224797 [Mycena filopes]